MLRGFYTVASGMIAQQRRQETLSNNIANAQTPGYKQDTASIRSFPELLIQSRGGVSPAPIQKLQNSIQTGIGSINTGVYIQEATPDFSQGSLRETGMATDLALTNGTIPDQNGSFFYMIQNEAGEVRYSRNGNFTVDNAGFLTTNQGLYVLDENGIPIFTDDYEFDVSEEGIIETDGDNIPLGIAYIADAATLAKDEQDLFRLEEAANPAVNARTVPGAVYTVQQKYLEGSNVDSMKAMTEMMNAYRSFEMNQTVLKAYDTSMEKTVNEVGRLR